MLTTAPARLIGGPFDGRDAMITRASPRITLAGFTYVRIDDPDTGQYLGGYVLEVSTE